MKNMSARYRYTRGIPTPRIAEILRNAAADASMSEADLTRTLGLRRRVVRRWLRGEEIPCDQEIEQFASACGALVIDLFPIRDVVEYDPSLLVLRVGDHAVGISDLSNDGVLRTYLSLVRAQRGLAEDAPVTLRVEDVEVLSVALDLDDEELEARLQLLGHMTAVEAHDARARILRAFLSQPTKPDPAP